MGLIVILVPVLAVWGAWLVGRHTDGRGWSIVAVLGATVGAPVLSLTAQALLLSEKTHGGSLPLALMAAPLALVGSIEFVRRGREARRKAIGSAMPGLPTRSANAARGGVGRAGVMSSDTRLMAFVALPQPLTTTAQALADRVQARFGSKTTMSVKAPGPAGGGILLDIDGVLITVLLIDQPLPPDAYAQALALDRVWPEAKTALAQHRAHAIVATLSPVTTHAQALTGAAYVTFVTAALMDLGPATAVIWTNGDALSQVSTFQRSADALVNRELPVLAWMSLAILQGPPSRLRKPTVATYTTGLAPFIGREIEFEPTTWPATEVAQRVLGTAQYLMGRGLVIKDGDTLGVDASEKIRARYLDQGQRPGVPVLRLAAAV